jgi:hypothetical protein
MCTLLLHVAMLWQCTKRFVFDICFFCSLRLVVTWISCLSGLYWLLHHRHCHDILVLPFPRWNGICKWNEYITLTCNSHLTLLNCIFCLCCLLLGCPPHAVTYVYSVRYAFWGSTCIHIHGSHHWDYHTRNQPKMVTGHVKKLHNCYSYIFISQSI